MEGIMDLFGITDGKKCEDICKYAPPENKWPCVDCDMRFHDRAEQITQQEFIPVEIVEVIIDTLWKAMDTEWSVAKEARKKCEELIEKNTFISEQNYKHEKDIK